MAVRQFIISKGRVLEYQVYLIRTDLTQMWCNFLKLETKIRKLVPKKMKARTRLFKLFKKSSRLVSRNLTSIKRNWRSILRIMPNCKEMLTSKKSRISDCKSKTALSWNVMSRKRMLPVYSKINLALSKNKWWPWEAVMKIKSSSFQRKIFRCWVSFKNVTRNNVFCRRN